MLVDLDEAGVVELDGDEVSSATLGSVAAYYYLDYRTTSEASINVDDFEDEVRDAPQRRREALAVAFLCAAREFDELPVRHNEDLENGDLASQLLDDDADTIQGLLELGYDSPHAKAQLVNACETEGRETAGRRLRDGPEIGNGAGAARPGGFD